MRVTVIHTHCWEAVLCYVIRQKYKFVHPCLRPLLDEYRTEFYQNPYAIDLLDLSKETLEKAARNPEYEPNNAIKYHMVKNPALDYYLHKYWWARRGTREFIYKRSIENPIMINPGQKTVMAILQTRSWRSELMVYSNPSQLLVDRIMSEGLFDLTTHPGLFMNPNPSVVRRIFEDIPELQLLYESPTADTELIRAIVSRLNDSPILSPWDLFCMNTHPKVLKVLAKVITFVQIPVRQLTQFKGRLVTAVLDHLPQNPGAFETFKQCTIALGSRLQRNALSANSHPEAVQMIVNELVADPGIIDRMSDFLKMTMQHSPEWVCYPHILKNTGLFEPDLPAWKRFVFSKTRDLCDRMIYTSAKSSAETMVSSFCDRMIYAPCWNYILAFVIRKPRKLVHPKFEKMFSENKELFYINPGAIDLLELGSDFFETLAYLKQDDQSYADLVQRVMRNPALDYFIRNHHLHKDIEDLTTILRNPGHTTTSVAIQFAGIRMPYIHKFREMNQLFYNPASAWVDKILMDEDIDEIYFRGMFENPNPRVARRVFRDFPELQRLYDSPVADDELVVNVINRLEETMLVWEDFFMNTSPPFVNLIAKIAEWSSRNPETSDVGCYWYSCMLSCLPRNPSATEIYLKWFGESDMSKHMVDFWANNHPKVIQMMLDEGGAPEHYSDLKIRLISENTGLFVPDELAWTRLVQQNASRLHTKGI